MSEENKKGISRRSLLKGAALDAQRAWPRSA